MSWLENASRSNLDQAHYRICNSELKTPLSVMPPKAVKSFLNTVIFTLLAVSSQAAVTYNFGGQGSTFDGLTSVSVSLVDGPTTFSMQVDAGGGAFNSNAGGLGIGTDTINGTSESVSISFNTDILFNFINLGAVGPDTSDGASFTIDGMTTNLFTGVTGFNGSTDVFTPSSPVSLIAGDAIVLTGSSATSIYDLEAINITAVPEPTTAILGVLGSLSLFRRRR